MASIVSRALAGLAATLVLVVCTLWMAAPVLATDESTPVVSGADLPLAPTDLISVVVVGQPDLSSDYLINDDGDINLPIIKKVHVAGLTTDQAETEITSRLQTVLRDVDVTVTRKAFGGIDVTVTGAVAKVGLLTVRRDSCLNDVIQQVGPDPTANLSKINVTSGLPGEQHETRVVDLEAFLDSGASDNNIPLHDGDVIFVPHLPSASSEVKNETIQVSVLGCVQKPGSYTVDPKSTVFDALSLAGGATENAAVDQIYVEPLSEGTRTIVDLAKVSRNPESPDVDPILHDGDKVIVPEAPASHHFTVTGAVLRPGTYALNGDTSLLEAISEAGGLSEHANNRKIGVVRVGPAGASSFTVDGRNGATMANTPIEVDDTINVPFSTPGHNTNDAISTLGSVVGLLGLLVLH